MQAAIWFDWSELQSVARVGMKLKSHKGARTALRDVSKLGGETKGEINREEWREGVKVGRGRRREADQER